MSHQTQNSELPSQNSLRPEKSFYDLAEVLVCDPVASIRAATRSALYSLGCRHIEVGGSLRDFLEALEHRPPDLALCEAQLGESELCRAIRELRHGEHSYNPFAIIIVTAWMPNAALATEKHHEFRARPGRRTLYARPGWRHLPHRREQVGAPTP